MTFFDLTGLDAVRRGLLDRPIPGGIARAHIWTRRTFALTVACLVLVCVLGFVRWQIDGAVVPWDSKNHFYPMFRFLGEALHRGTVPLWNPYHFGGYPAAADPQSLLFTPTMMLFAVLAPAASMHVFDGVVLGHLVAGGIGVLGLTRRWRWHPAGGLLAALVFILGGSASARLQHTGMIISYAWFPLALWWLEAALDRRSLRLAAGAGVLLALMALGRDQVAYLLCLSTVAFVAWRAAQDARPLRYVLERAPILAVAGLTTVALLAVPILLTLQFIHGSNRPDIAYGRALEGSLNPANLVTLFAPNAFGSLNRIYDYWGPGIASGSGDDITDRSMNYLFVGTLPVLLVLWHGLAGRRLFEPGIRFAALLLAAALLYALGRNTPFFGLVFDWLPAVSLYRRPADATFIVNIALALTAGYLLSRFIDAGLPTIVRGRAWLMAAVALILTALVVGEGMAYARESHHLDDTLLELAPALGAAALVVGAIWAGRAASLRRPLAVALVAVTAAQLLWLNTDSALNAEATSIYDIYEGLPPGQVKALAVLTGEIAARQAKGERPRVEILGLAGEWQNASMVLKLEDTLGYNPLRIAAYEKAVGATENSNDLMKRGFPDTFRGYTSRLAMLMGLDYIVLDRPIEDLPSRIPRPNAMLIASSRGFFVYRLDHVGAPRAYVATAIAPIDSDAIIGGGMMPSFEVGREALLDNADVAKLKARTELSAVTADRGASTARIVSYADNIVRLEVDAAAPGIVVLHDLAYPGWTATVDGAPTPVLRTNVLFRGAEVPAGHHVVEFAFHPLSLANLAQAAGSLVDKGP